LSKKELVQRLNLAENNSKWVAKYFGIFKR